MAKTGSDAFAQNKLDHILGIPASKNNSPKYSQLILSQWLTNEEKIPFQHVMDSIYPDPSFSVHMKVQSHTDFLVVELPKQTFISAIYLTIHKNDSLPGSVITATDNLNDFYHPLERNAAWDKNDQDDEP